MVNLPGQLRNHKDLKERQILKLLIEENCMYI